jgi:serine/threonine-protein kinase
MTGFGRYEILGKLGEGAMGIVYAARDHALGRVVALKTVSADLSADDELQQRFRREAEAIGRLNHPSVVTVYDLGQAEGQLYMAMELLEGEDLRRLIDGRAEIPLADKVRVMAQIAEGLGYAHSRGVVHRDVKPANILVTSAGRVKLLDFGLARVASGATITRRGVILGTPDYMAPEQAMGQGVDHRTDIFAAGSVFYEFLTFQKPFRGKTLHSVLYQILQEEPDPLLTVNPELPVRLAAVVSRMMRKAPAERWSAMADVERELAAIYVALRRSRGRSATPPAGAIPDETRAQARDRLARGKAHLDAGRPDEALTDALDALMGDPTSEDGAELAWRAGRARGLRRVAGKLSAEEDARVRALLQRAQPGAPAVQARQALAELALIAPDDPRVTELVRPRAAGPATAETGPGAAGTAPGGGV